MALNNLVSLGTVGWVVGIGLSSIIVAAWYFQDVCLFEKRKKNIHF